MISCRNCRELDPLKVRACLTVEVRDHMTEELIDKNGEQIVNNIIPKSDS